MNHTSRRPLRRDQQEAILDLVIAVQWADLAYDAIDFQALTVVAHEIGVHDDARALALRVYEPAELGTSDPTRLTKATADVALSYATAVVLARPTWDRHEMLKLLNELAAFGARTPQSATRMASHGRPLALAIAAA